MFYNTKQLCFSNLGEVLTAFNEATYSEKNALMGDIINYGLSYMTSFINHMKNVDGAERALEFSLEAHSLYQTMSQNGNLNR